MKLKLPRLWLGVITVAVLLGIVARWTMQTESAQVEHRSRRIDGELRTYRVAQPASRRSGARMPVLLALHGALDEVVVGANDKQVPPKAVDEARRAFAQAGHPAEWLMVPDHGHGMPRRDQFRETIWVFFQAR